MIGMGGVSNAEDVVRYLLCWAHSVQLGTSLTGDPERMSTITRGLEEWMDRKGYYELADFRGRILEWFS